MQARSLSTTQLRMKTIEIVPSNTLIYLHTFHRQAPIGDDNYLHLAARAGFDSQLSKRAYESDGLNQTEHCYEGLTRRIEDRRYDEQFRKRLDSDSINRRYENDNNTLLRYENSTDTIRSIQNDLRKFDNSLNSTLMRSERHERNGNENFDNHRRLVDGTGQSLLTSEGISLSGTLSRKLSNYDNTRKLDEGTLTRRIRDDASDISSSSMSGRGNH